MDPRMYPQGRDNRLDFTGYVPDKSDGGIFRAGTSATPLLSGTVTAVKALSFYIKSSAASGSAEAAYIRQYADVAGSLTIGALRAFASVNDVQIGNARGAHISLSFGSSGSVSGLGVALEATLHIPSTAGLAGTVAAIKAAINSDAATSDPVGARLSVFRVDNQGNATGAADVDTDCSLFDIAGFAAAAGVTNMVSSTSLAELPAGSIALRIKVNDAIYYIPAVAAAELN